jgi:hypothetical protein
MNKYIILAWLLFIKVQTMQAQNNLIFYGGYGDGWHSNNTIQASNDAVFLGGAGDGWHAMNYIQSSANVAFLGGAGDGWNAINYIQSSADVAFLGGVGDGWTKDSFRQASNDAVFLGGVGDGWTKDSFVQSSNELYLGGIGDGWVSQFVAEGPLTVFPLPLELLSFTGREDGDFHLLNWTTASENNTSHFIIEHATDAQKFLELGMRNAAGNSNSILDYNFSNQKPSLGNNFYRLKLVDLDGSYTLSNVVLLKKLASGNTIVLFPNPSATILNVEISGLLDNSELAMQIIDMAGKTVWNNKFIKNKSVFALDIETLASGIYQLIIVSKLEKNVLKFRKL